MKGGTNLGRDYYRALDSALRRSNGRAWFGMGTLTNPDRHLRIGAQARRLGISARQARRRIKAARRVA